MEDNPFAEGCDRRKFSAEADKLATLRFLLGVLRAPFSTGAISPTSQATALQVAMAAGVPTARRIVELGSGTGVVTREILAGKRPGVPVLAIERDPDFAASLDGAHPDLVVVEGCASRLRQHAEAAGFHRVDCVISALPWSLIAPCQQKDILSCARDLLSEGGVFVTLVCFGLHWLPNGRAFRARLEEVFGNVCRSPVLVGNLPPAFYYLCKAHGAGRQSPAAC